MILFSYLDCQASKKVLCLFHNLFLVWFPNEESIFRRAVGSLHRLLDYRSSQCLLSFPSEYQDSVSLFLEWHSGIEHSSLASRALQSIRSSSSSQISRWLWDRTCSSECKGPSHQSLLRGLCIQESCKQRQRAGMCLHFAWKIESSHSLTYIFWWMLAS